MCSALVPASSRQVGIISKSSTSSRDTAADTPPGMRPITHVREAVLQSARPLLDEIVITRVIAVIRTEEQSGVPLAPGPLHGFEQFSEQPVGIGNLSIVDGSQLAKFGIGYTVQSARLPQGGMERGTVGQSRWCERRDIGRTV